MKPLGAITKFYPFLSDETIVIIEDIVERSDSLHDITVGLVEEYAKHSMDSDMGILATLFAIIYPDTWLSLLTLKEKSILTLPLMMYIDGPSLSNENQDLFKKILKEAIDSEPEDWILFYLYLAGTLFLPNPEAAGYIEQARKLVEINPDIRRFLPFVAQVEAYSLRSEGDIQGVFKICDEALEIAREYDDFLSISIILIAKANTIKDLDPQKGLEILEDVYSLILGISGKEEANYFVAQPMALPYYAMGEYDMALELIRESYNVFIKYSENVPIWEALVFARVYNDLEMPKEALDWLYVYSSELEFSEGLPNCITACTFTLLEQLDKAAVFLEKARQYAFQSGFDGDVGNYQFVQGMYCLKAGDISAAVDCFEQSLNLSDPQFQVQVNSCLKALTRVEIAKIDVKAENVAETSGPWMTRLKKHAYGKNYLGIMMEYALLKAEYQIMIGEHEAAKQTLTDALEITDSVTVKTLRKRITDRLKEIQKAQVS
ncbi:MAG: tetratricopeptide repeat protein [Candidatus Thorarchaeota archaeon]